MEHRANDGQLSDFTDQIYRHSYLSGLHLKETSVKIRPPIEDLSPAGSPRPNGIYVPPQVAQLSNGNHTNGGPR